MTTGKLFNEAVTREKIGTGAVTSVKILDETITTADIAAGAITTAKILDGAVETADIKNGAVTTAKLNVDSGLDVNGGLLRVDSNTAATSKDSGALVVQNGGAGIEGALYVGGNVVSLGSVTAKDAAFDGDVTIDESITVTGASMMSSSLTVTGAVCAHVVLQHHAT